MRADATSARFCAAAFQGSATHSAAAPAGHVGLGLLHARMVGREHAPTHVVGEGGQRDRLLAGAEHGQRAGGPAAVVADTLLAPYNDLAAVEDNHEAFANHGEIVASADVHRLRRTLEAKP